MIIDCVFRWKIGKLEMQIVSIITFINFSSNAHVKKCNAFMEYECPLPCSQSITTVPYAESV